MPRNGVIVRENKDASDSFLSIMKNSRDISSTYPKMLEIRDRVFECTKFMRTMSKLLQFGNDETSYFILFANWIDMEIYDCFKGIEIPTNQLGLHEFRDLPKEMEKHINDQYDLLMDSFGIMNLIHSCKLLTPYKQHLCVEREETIKFPSGRSKVKKHVDDINIDNNERTAFANRLFNSIPGSTFKPFEFRGVDDLLSKLDDADVDADADADADNTETPRKLVAPIIMNNKEIIDKLINECRQIDIKQIYITGDETYKYAAAACMAKFYVRTYKLSKAIRIPDMDPSRLRDAIEAGLERYKNERTIKNNYAAYRELCDSVVMLEENFERYYDSYVKTGNISNIFEFYVMDVAEAKQDKQHMRIQFARIVNFFKMKAAPIMQNSGSPQLRMMFNAADRQFSSILSDAEKLDLEKV
jgi:hypothetical protein